MNYNARECGIWKHISSVPFEMQILPCSIYMSNWTTYYDYRSLAICLYCNIQRYAYIHAILVPLRRWQCKYFCLWPRNSLLNCKTIHLLFSQHWSRVALHSITVESLCNYQTLRSYRCDCNSYLYEVRFLTSCLILDIFFEWRCLIA